MICEVLPLVTSSGLGRYILEMISLTQYPQNQSALLNIFASIQGSKRFRIFLICAQSSYASWSFSIEIKLHFLDTTFPENWLNYKLVPEHDPSAIHYSDPVSCVGSASVAAALNTAVR